MQTAIAAGRPLQSFELFSDGSRALFGNIRQMFSRHLGPQFCELSYTALGDCRLSKISASQHRVIGEKVASHSSDEDSIKVLVQMDGRSNFQQADINVRLRRQSAVIYDPTIAYHVVNGTNVDQVILQIPRSSLSDRALKRLRAPLALPGGHDRQAATLASFILTSASSADLMSREMKATLGASLTCFTQGLICDSFGAAEVETLDSGSLLLLRERIKAYVHRQLGNHELSLEDVARAMGCSIRYLHRAFEGVGLTLQRYIWEARLDNSHRLLASQDHRELSISEIAFKCGFSSSSHFSRQFRERFAMSPRHLRGTAQTRPSFAR